jgi:hypothetical protein
MTAPSTLPGSCARATTARESRHRIDAPIAPARGARVVALDTGAAAAARRAGAQPWASARFFVCEPTASESEDGLLLRGVDGSPAALGEQLADADVVVMIATDDTGAASASTLGRACAARGIMTAGLVLGAGHDARDAVAALRPHARVLLPSAEESDVPELLTALRA